MKKALVAALTIASIWALGIFWSTRATRRVAGEFYRWVHQDVRRNHESFSDPIPETATELLERFSRCDEPFRDRVHFVPDGGRGQGKIPSLLFTTRYVGVSNGSSCSEGLSPISTLHFAVIRTKKEREGQPDGTLVVTVQTFLFGL